MIVVDILCLVIGVLGIRSIIRLYRWERMARRARIVVAYKNKSKINRPLIDWLQWCQSADKDKHATGQVVYKLGGTTIAVLEPVHAEHGKSTTKQITEA